MHDKKYAGLATIHSAPSALRQHIEWGLNAALGGAREYSWRNQPLAPGTLRTAIEFRATAGTAAAIASALKNWHYIHFEVQEMNSDGGEFFRFTPELGLHRALTDATGSILVTENVIRKALGSFDDVEIRDSLERALGGAWDEALEPMRGVDLQEVHRLRAI